ncbi:hypothetical protein [Bdellovibrio sp. NC01]|uniref:hypothetical protein n=1 Tax=Bdellovibrio sp. NC01 TaxID=2220073 RepID=UPI00115B0D5B|nr:hypothetical protein [Bdellovibrio sp. NC01]QDK37869.1 hypothetical protein DOE51_09870 [Bdellovibrio sp. NC01]
MKTLIALALVSLVSVVSQAADQFPKGPDANLTPGALCTRPTSHRYPEGINYCERNVDSGTKKDVFREYDKIGYRTLQMDRQKFKIDHYIPLCMGGANSEDNLWPQHVSVYTITDPLEPVLCEKMAQGKLLQKDAIAMIKYGKAHLDQVPAIIAKAQAL